MCVANNDDAHYLYSIFMANTMNRNDVLLVKEPQNRNLMAVSGISKDGELKTVPPKAEYSHEFMKIDRGSNALDNFFSNFMRQVKEPSRFDFFKVPSENAEVTAEFLSREMQNTDDPVSRKFVDNARIDPSDYINEASLGNEYKPYDIERVDWNQFEQLGVTRESLETSGALEHMLNYRKSPQLIDLSIQLADMNIRTQGRISMREAKDGRIVPVIHSIRKEPRLDRPFFEHKFTSQDKVNLRTTGNLGRVVELVNRNTGEITRSYVSVDNLTNELVATRADRVRIPNQVKGVELSDNQKQQLADGKEIYIEGMLSKSGKLFNANLQYNADKRGFEFRFTQQQNQNNSEQVRIPNRLGGQELSPQEQQDLKEGKTIYIEGLKDRAGKEYNAYIKINNENKKIDFFRWNPDKAQNISPESASQTQVAVNSQGKTNEATKNIKEPLKSQQTEPTEQQQPKRSKGLRL